MTLPRGRGEGENVYLVELMSMQGGLLKPGFSTPGLIIHFLGISDVDH
jgi:hypothetical protein